MLLIVDKSKGFFEYGPVAFAQLPVLMSLALLSYGLRYLRWFWLLGAEASSTRVDRLMSAFVFERALNLAVVLVLTAIFVADKHMFWLAASLVSLFLISLVVAGLYPEVLRRLSVFCVEKQWMRFSRLFEFLANVLRAYRSWIKPRPMMISLIIEEAACLVTSSAFVHLLDRLNIEMPWFAAFSLYLMAMLVGAASMLPGGIDSSDMTRHMKQQGCRFAREKDVA